MYVPNFLGGARIRPEVLFFDSGGGADDGGDGCCLVGGLAVNEGGGGGSSGGGGGLVGFTFMISAHCLSDLLRVRQRQSRWEQARVKEIRGSVDSRR